MSRDFLEAVETIAEFAEALDNEHIKRDPIPRPVDPEEEHGDDEAAEQAEGTLLTIFPERNEGPVYRVVGFPDDRYFEIQSSFNLVGRIAQELDDETATEILAEFGGNYEEEYLRSFGEDLDDADIKCIAAALGWLDSLNDEKIDQLIYDLSEIFVSAPVKYRINATESGQGISGFQTRERIFPYESEFSISQFNQAVERVRLPAHLGRLYLDTTFRLNTNDANEEAERQLARDLIGSETG